MTFITDNLSQSLLVVGLALLAIEVVVLGFATFMLFFVGLAAIITSLLMYVGVLSPAVIPALACWAVLTAFTAAVLWKPLKNMQKQVEQTDVKSDLVGHIFVLECDVSPTQVGRYEYSGITWKLNSTESLTKGTRVEVTKAEVGNFYIKQALH